MHIAGCEARYQLPITASLQLLVKPIAWSRAAGFGLSGRCQKPAINPSNRVILSWLLALPRLTVENIIKSYMEEMIKSSWI
jgi:hypothetical protein